MSRCTPRSYLVASIVAAAAIFAAPGAAHPQRSEPRLPAEVEAAVIDFWNDPRRERFRGATEVPADSVIEGDVAVLEGPLHLAGRVVGSVVVVNGDLVLGKGAVVTGDLLLVGGVLTGLDAAEIGGEILRYPARLRYRLEGERMMPGGPAPAAPREDRHDAPPPAGGAELDFLITTGNSYNRVEGMPITFGPRLRGRSPNPLHLYALAIYRTESGITLDPSHLGYYVRAEQHLAGGDWRAGATLHSVIDPIEDWHLSDLENGLATFLFHQDFRDHYEREGLSAFTTFAPGRAPFTVSGEVRWEMHRSRPAGSPLTLFDNAEPWRPQPVVGEGRLGSLRLQATYDTRSEVADPAAGWYLRGVLEQGFHAELTRPETFPTLAAGEAAGPAPSREFGRFTRGFADLRRYNRLSPDVRLNLRTLIGGSLTGSPLPPQRQHALGGEGSLPGYPFFSEDCGARAVQMVTRPGGAGDPAYPMYGCDAFFLAQAELRGKLDFRLRLDTAPWEDDDEEDSGLGWNIAPDWVFFVNGGTGWAFDDRPDGRFRADTGAGLLIDRLGIFFAVPIDGSGRANVFVRIGPRF